MTTIMILTMFIGVTIYIISHQERAKSWVIIERTEDHLRRIYYSRDD